MFFRKKHNIKNKSEPVSNLSQLFELFRNGDISASALNSTTYFTCMQIRCNAIAKIPLKLKKYTQDTTEDVNNSFSRLLNFRPNPFTTAHDFFWATEYQRLEYGNSYWVKSMNLGKISGLYLLHSPNVTVYYDDACILDNSQSVFYTYSDPKKGIIFYKSDEIVHFKNFSHDGIVGQPIKKYILDVIDSEKYGRNVIKTKSKDGLQNPVVVQYTGDLNKENQKLIKKRFDSLGGASNAGKVIPIPQDFTVTQLETRLVDAQFFELQGLNTQQIANAFGVKSFQLNDMERSTYNNVAQQNNAFYSDTMQNVYTDYEQEIDYKLLFETERNLGYYTKFNVDVMLRSDIESRYTAYQTGIASGFLKISEVRKKEDLPFVEGTDKLIVGNGASIPLDDLGIQYDNTKEKEE